MRMMHLPDPEEALPGRSMSMPVPARHEVLGHQLQPPFTESLRQILFGMGCFWGAEKKFWQVPGVYSTAVGYSAGFTPNPLYEEVCSGMTGHNEVVLVVYDPSTVSLEYLLKVFWQGHNPTLGMRQGNDMGTQYRSGIYWFDEEQRLAAVHSAQSYQAALDNTCPGKTITTEILAAQEFYYAEPYHQQYLIKNPGGYCPDISCQATGLPTFPS